jgi:hypothetical protein
MKLAELDLDTFVRAVIKVNGLMDNQATCSELLDAAALDTPIIGELMTEMNKLYQCADGPKKKKGVAAAQRDLTVLLALREIESAEI